MGSEYEFRAERLVHSYGKTPVLKNVSLGLNVGEVVGLLGPNGAGKTTSFHLMVGFIKPQGGSVWLRGKAIGRLPLYRRSRMGIGFLPQEPSVFGKLSVEDNVMTAVETLRLPRAERRSYCQGQLERFGLEALAKHKAQTLSGGERRRLELARTLARSPKFILLDEPFSGVDPIKVRDLKNLILGLKQQGIGVLITDHNARELLDVVDRAYVLSDGVVIAEGEPEFLVRHPDCQQFYFGQHFAP